MTRAQDSACYRIDPAGRVLATRGTLTVDGRRLTFDRPCARQRTVVQARAA